jgi:hypothetical protein
MPVPNLFETQSEPIPLAQLDANFAAFQLASGSSLLGYNQGGSGAVTITQQAKNQQYLSSKDFGTVGDGVTNDTAALAAAITYANSLGNLNSQYAVLHIEPGTYLITPGGLPIVLCDIEGPRAAIVAASNALGAMIQLGVPSGVYFNAFQRIKLFSLQGYNFQFDGNAGVFVGSTSGSSTTLTISSTTTAAAVGQIIAPGVAIQSIGTYNGTSGTVILTNPINIPSPISLTGVYRYGIGIQYIVGAGLFSPQMQVDIGAIQGFLQGISSDQSVSNGHVGTMVYNISSLWFNNVGIYAISGNLQFENSIFNIVYGTGNNTTVYLNSLGTEHNIQNVFNFAALELHRLYNSVGFSLNGANTMQNTFNVTSLSYTSNTKWIVLTDTLANGNVYNLPIFDTAANNFHISMGNDVIRAIGFGQIDVQNPMRSLVYGPSGTIPTWTGIRSGDRYIVNNPSSYGPASYVYSNGYWNVETSSGNIFAGSTWTPTVTAVTGTFTSASASGTYGVTNGYCTFSLTVSITTNGTAAGGVICTLPITPTKTFVACGRADSVSGKGLQAKIASGGNITIYNSDGSYPGSNGETLIVSGSYQVA